jgi:hypothetical protein
MAVSEEQIIVVLIILLVFYFHQGAMGQPARRRRQVRRRPSASSGSGCGCQRESFSLSKKPFEADGTYLHRNPFDNIDYQTPTFHLYPAETQMIAPQGLTG